MKILMLMKMKLITMKLYDKMSVTKSHSGILVNVKYQLNKLHTFTMQIRNKMDNINRRNK